MFTKIKQLIVDDGIGGLIVIVLVAGTIGYWIGSWQSIRCNKCSDAKLSALAARRQADDQLGRSYVSGWDYCIRRFNLLDDERARLNKAYEDGWIAATMNADTNDLVSIDVSLETYEYLNAIRGNCSWEDFLHKSIDIIKSKNMTIKHFVDEAGKVYDVPNNEIDEFMQSVKRAGLTVREIPK